METKTENEIKIRDRHTSAGGLDMNDGFMEHQLQTDAEDWKPIGLTIAYGIIAVCVIVIALAFVASIIICYK